MQHLIANSPDIVFFNFQQDFSRVFLIVWVGIALIAITTIINVIYDAITDTSAVFYVILQEK